MAKEILIAVSEKLDQEEFKKIFEATPYRLIFSENGEDALQQIKFFKPNLVIADTALSEKTGLQLCQAVKTDREFKQIPFILVKGIIEEVSESEVDRVHADAIVSKPLHEGDLLTLADRLMEAETVGKKERSLLDELEGVDDGEIIELVEVVEEPESRVSIDDFLAQVKEKGKEKEELPEMPPLESWEKPTGKEERHFEEEIALALGGKVEEVEKKMDARVTPLPPQKAPAGEALEKVALEEILLKVEKLRPVIEQEFLGKEEAKVPEETLSLGEEPFEKSFSLEDFTAALQKEAAEESTEKALPPIVQEEIRKQAPSEIPPLEVLPSLPELESDALEEEDLQSLLAELEKHEPSKKASPEEIVLEEEELTAEALEEALKPLFAKKTEGEAASEMPRAEFPLEEPTLKKFAEEVIPEEVIPEEVIPEEELPRELFEKATPQAEGPEVQELEAPEKIGSPAFLPEEEMRIATALETPTIDLLEEAKTPTFVQQEEQRVLLEPIEQMAATSEAEKFQKVEAEKPIERPEEEVIWPQKVEMGKPLREETARPPGATDKEIEEIIAKGVRAMVEDFMTKVVPEVTQNIVTLTVERIEKMVKEIVPDIAEKAVQDEIRRLEEGEKD